MSVKRKGKENSCLYMFFYFRSKITAENIILLPKIYFTSKNIFHCVKHISLSKTYFAAKTYFTA